MARLDRSIGDNTMTRVMVGSDPTMTGEAVIALSR